MIEKMLRINANKLILPCPHFCVHCHSVLTQGRTKEGRRQRQEGDSEDDESRPHDAIFSQDWVKKVQKKCELAVTKELGQFYDMSVFILMDPIKVSKAERATALASLIFLKPKKDGTIMTRACADGRK